MRPPSGPNEKAKAMTSRSAAAARSAPWIALRNAGARQVAADADQALRHARWCSRHSASAKAACACRSAGRSAPAPAYAASSLARFDAAVDLAGRRVAEEAQRVERGKRRHRQGRHQCRAAPCRAARRKTPNQDRLRKRLTSTTKRQDERPAAFDAAIDTAPVRARTRKPSGKAETRWFSLVVSVIGLPGAGGARDSSGSARKQVTAITAKARRGSQNVDRRFAALKAEPVGHANPARSGRHRSARAARRGNGRRRPALPAPAAA